ncbi:efflux RND transporter permease subunit, partial [Aliarcobacter butzleri]
EPNYSSLAIYGISIDEVMQVIKNGIGEEEITEKIEGIKRFGVVAKIKDAKKDIDSIKKITLRSSSGAIVNLDQICKISVVQGASFIKREDLNRYLVLSIEVNERDIASFVKEADEIIKKEINIPSGYYISWVGDFKNMQEATKKLMIIIPLTILLVMLLLFMAFNSIKKVGLILLNVPFGLIGAIISLSISGVYLSVSAIVGFIAIFAIAILNGIVLVSFIDELREKYPHTNLKILLKDATLLRLRPVLMTAFTALLGILPLLFATGVGSEIQYPLAVVVVGGVISSTILTLLILPSTYFLFYEKSQYVEQNKN